MMTGSFVSTGDGYYIRIATSATSATSGSTRWGDWIEERIAFSDITNTITRWDHELRQRGPIWGWWADFYPPCEPRHLRAPIESLPLAVRRRQDRQCHGQRVRTKRRRFVQSLRRTA